MTLLSALVSPTHRVQPSPQASHPSSCATHTTHTHCVHARSTRHLRLGISTVVPISHQVSPAQASTARLPARPCVEHTSSTQQLHQAANIREPAKSHEEATRMILSAAARALLLLHDSNPCATTATHAPPTKNVFFADGPNPTRPHAHPPTLPPITWCRTPTQP